MPKLQNSNRTSEKALVSDISALSVLQNINWDFSHKAIVSPNETGPFNCRKYHSFPGTFIPEIPFTLIEVLSLPEATIFDPFSGIGTTYFQALTLNRIPLVTEICTVAFNISKSMYVLFNPKINLDYLRIQLFAAIGRYDETTDYSNALSDSSININKLRPWYDQESFNKICFLCSIYCDDESLEIRALCMIVISSILKTVSSQDRGWGCVADNMLPTSEQIEKTKEKISKQNRDVFSVFKKSANILVNDLLSHKRLAEPNYKNLYSMIENKQTIFQSDIREANFIQDHTVDMIITSPPYPNMIDYVTSQRLSYYFLGADIPLDTKREIGARNRRKRKDSLDKYVQDMNIANKVMIDKLKIGGYACFVMPAFNEDNKKNLERKIIMETIMSKFEELGLSLIFEFTRCVSNKRRDHNSKWTSLEQEKILIYKKG